MAPISTGLARVTISSPQRRVDVALPDTVPLADLLPELLARAGDGLADEGERHGGWVLRRPDGTALSTTVGLADQGVRDGMILHLVAARTAWPELEYDDVVEAIAAGARRYGMGWSPRAGRYTALAVAGLLLAVGLVAAPRTHQVGPALAVALVLIAVGAAVSRAYGQSDVGAALAGFGLPYAFVGGLLAVAGPAGDRLLVGSAALLLAGAVGALGVAHALRVFVGGATAGALGVAGAVIGVWTTPAGAAAVMLVLLVTGVAAVPLLAIRFGKLPMPLVTVPGAVPPVRARIFAAVARTDEMLTGMLLGLAVAAVGASTVLVRGGDPVALVLVGVVGTTFLLRARLFVTVRQRLPLLGIGVAAVVLLAGRWLAGTPAHADRQGALVVAVAPAAVALLVALAGSRYADTPPSPYLGRAADILDALCVVSVVPIACAILGLYGRMRGIVG